MNYKKAVGISALAIIVLVFSGMLSQLLASALLLVKVPAGICNIVAGILYIGITYIVLKMLIEKILKLEFSDFGIPKFYVKGKWILAALLLPIAVKGSYFLFIPGEYVLSGMSADQIFQTLSAGIFYIGIAAGFVEEMVFRGLILNCIKKAWNEKAAIIIPSVLFGLLHVLGQDYSVGNSLLVIFAGTMAGIMFSLIAIENNSVWNSGIVHALWNIFIIGGGLAIGEKADSYSVATYVIGTKSFAITGGEFGIESSVIALAGYCIVAIVAFAMIKSRQKK